MWIIVYFCIVITTLAYSTDKSNRGAVVGGKQLDGFIGILKKLALSVAIELKSQVGSYGNNFNNRTEETLGSAIDFWTAFRKEQFPHQEAPWLGYMMITEMFSHPLRLRAIF